MEGRRSLLKKRKPIIDLLPDNANVDFIDHSIKSCWGEAYKLVTCGGLEIEDSITTHSTYS